MAILLNKRMILTASATLNVVNLHCSLNERIFQMDMDRDIITNSLSLTAPSTTEIQMAP